MADSKCKSVACPRRQDAGAESHAGYRRWLAWLLPLVGFLALVWAIVRLVPKPSRAAYPCQRVTLPLATGFVLWVAGIVGSAFAYRRAKDLLRRSKLALAAACMAVAIAAGLLAVSQWPSDPVLAAGFEPNDPIGVARGVNPGRVVWVHDADATDWAGTNTEGEDIGDGYWWEDEHTDQGAVDAMVSTAVKSLTDASSNEAAWDAIFRHFNDEKGKGDVGYTTGEPVMIKVNLVTANYVHADVDAQGNQTRWLGWVNTSPQMIVALLDQLVNVVGVAEQDITVGDSTANFPNHYYTYCHDRFPDVNYLEYRGTLGRLGAVSSEGQPNEARVYWSHPDAAGAARYDYLPVSYADAEYLINLACLKGHSAGITLCAKNHYGSFIRLPSDADYYNLHFSLPNAQWSPGSAHYRAHVDIMGHSKLGGATLLYLVDGLYGGYGWEGRPSQWEMPPFDGDWPSSLFVSQDPVAIDSVGYDFLLEEWPHVVAAAGLQGGAEDYLHEAALADDPPSSAVYDPDNTGQPLPSLGVHEHWNNAVDKQYTGNVSAGDGIELLGITVVANGDYSRDGGVDLDDFAALTECLGDPDMPPSPVDPITPYTCTAAFDFDADGDVDLRDVAAFQMYFLEP